jgi:hypothetical protein
MIPADLVSPLAARHGDPIVKAFARDFLPLFFARRRQLRAPYKDVDGNLLLPAIPEFLSLPPCKRRKGEAKGQTEPREDLNYRRADHCRVLCLVWSTVIACTDWRTKEMREPTPSENKGYRFLSVERLAELAGVAVWQAESVLFDLRAARQITFTHQHREELADGSHHSTGAALRRVSLDLLGRTPCTARVLAWRRGKLERRAAKRDRRQAREGLAAPIIAAQREAPPVPRRQTPDLPPAELVDQVGTEHPDWSLGDVQAEAWRRHRQAP